jgi:adenylate kinase family enzyme
MACRYRRLVVIGPTGSGKSTLASRLAGAQGLDFVELDALYWEPHWKPADLADFRARAEKATRASGWVVAGNYRLVRDIVWPRAQAVVWLDLPFRLVLWRLTSRTVTRAVTREVLWNSNRETFWEHLMLWSERSLFHWLLKTYWRHKRENPKLLALPEHRHLEVVHLQSPQEIEAWLQAAGS